MRRRWPNPWIALPALAFGALGGVLGWVVTDAACRQGGESCAGWATVVAVISFTGVVVGVALVMVLVYKSLAEWRERSTERG